MSLNREETKIVESAVDGEIVTLAVIRLYQSNQNEYKYFSTGAITLLYYPNSRYAMKLIDLKSKRITWELEIVGDIKYYEDRPYFHSFLGNTCMIGFHFTTEIDAKSFCNSFRDKDHYVPQNTEKHLLRASQTSNPSLAIKSSSIPNNTNVTEKKKETTSGFFGFGRKDSEKKSKLDKSMISAPVPDSFEHRSHVGFNSTTGFSVDNIPMGFKNI